MTCIVGVIDDGKCIIGGDSCACDDDQYTLSFLNKKVFNKSEVLIGVAGLYRVVNILMFFNPPKLTEKHVDEFLLEYMVNKFVPSFQKLIDKNGLSIDYDRDFTFELMVGIRGYFFHVDCLYGVTPFPKWGGSIGTGAKAAKGSLFTTKDMELTAENRLLLALQSAEATTTNVKAPFDIIRI